MTVEIVYGPVGSGKSYTQLARAFDKLSFRHKHFVVANFDISLPLRKSHFRDRWLFISDADLDPRKLMALSFSRGWFGHESSALLIIDEAGATFNSREWQSKDRLLWLKFLAHSRKFGFDVVFICQSPIQVDKQIRSSVEFLVKVINFRNFLFLRWLPVRVFGLVRYWTAGNFRGTLSFSIFRRSVARLYNTSELFDPQVLNYKSRFDLGFPLELWDKPDDDPEVKAYLASLSDLSSKD